MFDITVSPEATRLGATTWITLDPALGDLTGSTITSASTCGVEPVDPGPDDAVTRLGDIFRNMPQRQPLSPREKHRRRRRNWLAKLSRRRNRR